MFRYLVLVTEIYWHFSISHNLLYTTTENTICDKRQILTFVAYDVCRLMTFVMLWRLSSYDVKQLWRLSVMTFVTLLCLSLMTLSHNDNCRQLWRLSLIGFVVVSRMGIQHCLKSHFFRLAVSKCSVIYHWYVCDRSQRKSVLN